MTCPDQNNIIQDYPLGYYCERENIDEHCGPPPTCPPQPCHAKPRDEQHCAGGAGHGPLPPPIPPVRYVPGLNVQEQLQNMASAVNVCVDRWNQIQGKCYEALNRTVGAAVSNDVYYDPCEISYRKGYSEADGCVYEIIETKPVDSKGNPIFLQLKTAYNAGLGTTREAMSDVSFVTSANAAVTARLLNWRGLTMTEGNPLATAPAVAGDFTVGWTRSGKMRVFDSKNFTIEDAQKNQITDCIGPVLPIIIAGAVTEHAKNYPATPAAIQAIGYKQCNGNKVLFSCGLQDQPGCSVKNVADILQSMGVTTAVVTCAQTAYGQTEFAATLSDDNTSLTNTTPDTRQATDTILGMTGGMQFIGAITDMPLQYQMPQNSAFWIVSKRPFEGWRNRFTGEIADIAQRLSHNSNELAVVKATLDKEQEDLLNILSRLAAAEAVNNTQNTRLDNIEQTLTQHTTTLQTLNTRVTTAEQNIATLQTELSKETQARIAKDTELSTQILNETSQRVIEDGKLSDRINTLQTALTEEQTARNLADQNLSNAISNEVNARQTADVNLDTKIAQEAVKREAADEALQEQIDALDKNVNIVPGAGLGMTVSANGTKTFYASIGGGVRLDGLNRLTIDTGKGVAVVDGKVTLKLSDCFTYNEKGELTVNCCCENDKINAGAGLEYSVNTETGETSLNVKPATGTTLGGVKAGSGVTIEADGTINANGAGSYTLPEATPDTLGGVKIGENIDITDGTISTHPPYELPKASADTLGGIRLGENLVADENGVVSAQIPDGGGGASRTILAGDGINVTQNNEENTATVALSDDTKATLAEIGDVKDQVNAQGADITALKNGKVSVTTYQTDMQSVSKDIADAQGDATSAQTQAAQANAAVADLSTELDEIKTTANNAASTAATAQVTATAAQTAAVQAQATAEANNPEGKYVKADGTDLKSPTLYFQNGKSLTFNANQSYLVVSKFDDYAQFLFGSTEQANNKSTYVGLSGFANDDSGGMFIAHSPNQLSGITPVCLQGINSPESPYDGANKLYADTNGLFPGTPIASEPDTVTVPVSPDGVANFYFILTGDMFDIVLARNDGTAIALMSLSNKFTLARVTNGFTVSATGQITVYARKCLN